MQGGRAEIPFLGGARKVLFRSWDQNNPQD